MLWARRRLPRQDHRAEFPLWELLGPSSSQDMWELAENAQRMTNCDGWLFCLEGAWYLMGVYYKFACLTWGLRRVPKYICPGLTMGQACTTIHELVIYLLQYWAWRQIFFEIVRKLIVSPWSSMLVMRGNRTLAVVNFSWNFVSRKRALSLLDRWCRCSCEIVVYDFLLFIFTLG